MIHKHVVSEKETKFPKMEFSFAYYKSEKEVLLLLVQNISYKIES